MINTKWSKALLTKSKCSRKSSVNGNKWNLIMSSILPGLRNCKKGKLVKTGCDMWIPSNKWLLWRTSKWGTMKKKLMAWSRTLWKDLDSTTARNTWKRNLRRIYSNRLLIYFGKIQINTYDERCVWILNMFYSVWFYIFENILICLNEIINSYLII